MGNANGKRYKLLRGNEGRMRGDTVGAEGKKDEEIIAGKA